MSLQRIDADAPAFLDALLPVVKAHCRVEFTRDDDYLRQVIARAAAEVERVTGQAVLPVRYIWRPDAADLASRDFIACACPYTCPAWDTVDGRPGGLRLPVRPVSALVVLIGGADRTPQFRLVGSTSSGSAAPLFLVGADAAASVPPTGGAVVIQFTAGAGGATVPAGLLDLLLRLSAHLYENRELVISPGMGSPDWRDAVMTQWVPRV